MRTCSFFIAIFFLFASCGQGPSSTSPDKLWVQEKERLRVLCTTEMLASLVQAVGGPYIHNLVLIKGDLDPHSYEPVKGDQEKLFFAQLIVCNGLGLEHGPSLKQHLQSSSKVFSAGGTLLAREALGGKQQLLFVDQQYDPHIWMDLSLFSQALLPLAKRLSASDPAHAKEFEARAIRAKERCEEEHQKIQAYLAKLPANKRYLVTSHDAFHYFTRAYLATALERQEGSWKERVKAPEGFAPEGKLSLYDMKNTVDYLLKYQVHKVFTEANVNQDAIQKIVDICLERGMEVSLAKGSLFSDSMGREGRRLEDYFDMLWHNARVFFEEMSSSKLSVEGG